MANNRKDDKKIKKFQFKLNLRNIFIIVFVFLFLFYAYQSVNKEIKQVMPEKSITTIVKEAKDGKIKSADIIDNKIIIYYKDGKLATAFKEPSDSFSKILRDSGVNPDNIQINIKDTTSSSGLANIIGNLLPTILMVAFFIFLFRQAKGTQESVFSFGQSKAKRFSKSITKTTFADVAGVDEAKKELVEIVDFLKNPEKYVFEPHENIYLSSAFKRKSINGLTFSMLILLGLGRISNAIELFFRLFQYGPGAFAAGFFQGTARSLAVVFHKLTGKYSRVYKK